MQICHFKAFPDAYRQSMTLYGQSLKSALGPLLAKGESVQDYLPGFICLRPALSRYVSQYLGYQAAAFFSQGDVNHILDHSYAHLLYSINPKKTVVTFHDAIWLENKNRSWIQSYNLKALQRAARIICVSESSKKNLLRFLDYPERKIKVITNGLHEIFESPAAPASLPDLKEGPYLLHVGHTQVYKNIPALFHVLAILKKMGKSTKLLKVGTPFTKEQLISAEDLNVKSDIVHLGQIEQSQMPAVYKKAQVLLMPSLDEGFGFPALEAMAMGVPVVVSNRGSFPELVGNAGILTEPYDYAGMAKAICEIFDNQVHRARLVEEGKKRAVFYTWKESARKVLELYRSVYQESKR